MVRRGNSQDHRAYGADTNRETDHALDIGEVQDVRLSRAVREKLAGLSGPVSVRFWMRSCASALKIPRVLT